MRVLVVTTDFPPYSSGGGGQNIMLTDVNLLRASGATVTVACGRSAPPVRSIVNGIEVIRLNFPNIPPRSLWFQIVNRDLLLALARRVDIVYAYSWSCSLLINSIKASGIPVVIRLGGSPVSNIASFARTISDASLGDFFFFLGLGPLYGYLLRKELRDSTHLLLDSEHIETTLERQFGLPILGKSTIIRTTCSFPPTVQDKVPVEKSIVYVGRLVSTKGIMDLLRAFSLVCAQSEYAEWKLVLIGDGQLRSKLLKESERLGCRSRLFLLGRLQLREVFQVLRRSYMFVLPSYNESASVALCEAMAVGLPVIVPNLPWATEQTKGYSSKIFFPIGDVNGLAQSIRTTSQTHWSRIPKERSSEASDIVATLTRLQAVRSDGGSVTTV